MTELRNKLLWVIVARVVVATLFLGSAILFNLVPKGLIPTTQLLTFLSITYFLSIVYFFLWVFTTRYRFLLHVQLLADLITVTALVYFSGVQESIFTMLYLLIITYASILYYRKGGVTSATLSTIFYVGMVDLGYFGFIPASAQAYTFQSLSYQVLLVVSGFVAVAYLGTSLSERLRHIQRELEEKSDRLADLRRLHENIVSSIRSGLITTDLRGLITSFNAAAAEISGFNEDQMVGKSVASLLGEDFLNRVLETNLALARRALRHETWARTRFGEQIFLGTSVSPLLNKSSRMAGYVVSFQDLTETKKLEEQVRLKEKMAAVGSMAAGIAHEIRNPLASMRGSIQVLRDDLNAKGEKRKLLDIVLRESDRLDKIIEDFLRYACTQSAPPARMNVKKSLTDTLELLKNSPEVGKSHHIELNLPRYPLELEGNPDQVVQVFWNLAKNSLRAMPGGGTLRVDASRENGKIAISFTDTGVGMTDAEKHRIFHPFDGSFAQGSGLGMAIVYQIINNHKGEIKIRSEKGKGTTVTIELPLTQ
ncbi:MAG: PAS domain S-box protein [Acidobacteria bacterium]|nr:PAS domain S-box protein [Acidobacteriota bacterium]